MAESKERLWGPTLEEKREFFYNHPLQESINYRAIPPVAVATLSAILGALAYKVGLVDTDQKGFISLVVSTGLVMASAAPDIQTRLLRIIDRKERLS